MNSTLGVGTVPFRSVRYRNRFARPLDRGTGAPTGGRQEIFGSGATGNVVQGNFIGTDASGANLGNIDAGVFISGAPNNTIGGTNTIGHNTNGIDITGSGATGNVVLGNFIGTNAGDADLGNIFGVLIENSASNNTIGGANTIGHNSNTGIDITGSGATGNVVLGNFIGTDDRGANLGNGDLGVVIIDAPKNTIGGAGAAANTIGNNASLGIYITGSATGSSGATGNMVLGNFIGTNASGANLGNSMGGVVIGASNNTIGGANIIGHNGIGIEISKAFGPSATGNVVQGNFIGTNPGGANLGNSARGVVIADASNNTIGGHHRYNGTGIDITGSGHATRCRATLSALTPRCGPGRNGC